MWMIWEDVSGYSDSEDYDIVTAATNIEPRFNPLHESVALFLKEIPTELPPLRAVNHKTDKIPGLKWGPLCVYLVLVCGSVRTKVVSYPGVAYARLSGICMGIYLRIWSWPNHINHIISCLTSLTVPTSQFTRYRWHFNCLDINLFPTMKFTIGTVHGSKCSRTAYTKVADWCVNTLTYVLYVHISTLPRPSTLQPTSP